MKLITTVITPLKLGELQAALMELGISGMKVTQVKGLWRRRGHTGRYRDAEYSLESVPHSRVEVAVRADLVDRVTEAIVNVAKTGKVWDAKIFIGDLQQVVRVRSSETDEPAR